MDASNEKKRNNCEETNKNNNDKPESTSINLKQPKLSNHKKMHHDPLRTVEKPYRFGIPGGAIFERCGSVTKLVELHHVKLTTDDSHQPRKQLSHVDKREPKTPLCSDKEKNIDPDALKCTAAANATESDRNVAKMPPKSSSTQESVAKKPAPTANDIIPTGVIGDIKKCQSDAEK